MKTTLPLTIAAFVLTASNLSATTLYVSLESTNPVVPYSTWTTAATNIQDAVDESKNGDVVLVKNGVYAVGGKTNDMGWVDNRVTITNAIRLESVNGPLATTIHGGGSVRCVFLGANSVLSGFTLTKGSATNEGGGVFCEPTASVTNCILSENGAGRIKVDWGGQGHGAYGHGAYGGGAYGGVLYNCILTRNSSWFEPWNVQGGIRGYGGGAYNCTLYDCKVSENWASTSGGGTAACLLFNCELTGNSARYGGGGGAYGGTLNNCTLTANSADLGGGAFAGTLYNCTVTGNDGGNDGGGTAACLLFNCELTGNSAWGCGGGAYGGTLYNCTLTGNSAYGYGGGAYRGTLYNCTVTGNGGCGAFHSTIFNSIVYYNLGLNYDPEGTVFNFSCTTPLPTNGVGNITGPPLLMDRAAGDLRLHEASPCIDAGTNLVGLLIVPWTNPDTGDTTLVPYTYDATDMLGNSRFVDGNFDGRVAWDMGAYEFKPFPPPRFSSPPRRTSDGWKLNLTGAPNQWVHVQRSSNLKDWEEIWYDWMGSAGEKLVIDGDTGQKAMFYRAFVDQ